jgi:hypothetical protein
MPKKLTHWFNWHVRMFEKLSLISRENVEATPTVASEAMVATDRPAHADDGSTVTSYGLPRKCSPE